MKREHQTILALITAGSLASVLMAGCCNSGLSSKRGGCNDVTPGAMPDECGESLNRFALMQKRSAEALSYAIFTNEWYMGGQTLGPYGAYHVQQMSKLLPTVPYNVLIQPSLDPALNEAHRQLVVARLLTAGVLDAEVRISPGVYRRRPNLRRRGSDYLQPDDTDEWQRVARLWIARSRHVSAGQCVGRRRWVRRLRRLRRLLILLCPTSEPPA